MTSPINTSPSNRRRRRATLQKTVIAWVLTCMSFYVCVVLFGDELSLNHKDVARAGFLLTLFGGLLMVRLCQECKSE